MLVSINDMKFGTCALFEKYIKISERVIFLPRVVSSFFSRLNLVSKRLFLTFSLILRSYPNQLIHQCKNWRLNHDCLITYPGKQWRFAGNIQFFECSVDSRTLKDDNWTGKVGSSEIKPVETFPTKLEFPSEMLPSLSWNSMYSNIYSTYWPLKSVKIEIVSPVMK